MQPPPPPPSPSWPELLPSPFPSPYPHLFFSWARSQSCGCFFSLGIASVTKVLPEPPLAATSPPCAAAAPATRRVWLESARDPLLTPASPGLLQLAAPYPRLCSTVATDPGRRRRRNVLREQPRSRLDYFLRGGCEVLCAATTAQHHLLPSPHDSHGSPRPPPSSPRSRCCLGQSPEPSLSHTGSASPYTTTAASRCRST